MPTNSFRLATVVFLILLLSPTDADAYGAAHVGYTHVGPNGVYHTGATVAAGPGGVATTSHTTAYGAGGGAYHSSYGTASGGYHYDNRYSGYGGTTANYNYSYVR